MSGLPEAQTDRRATAEVRLRRSQSRTAWLMLAPDVIGLGIFLVLPMILSIVFSFFDIDGFGNYRFEGLGNYRQLVSDPQFWASLAVSAKYAVVFVPLVFVVGLLLALLIKDAFPGLAFVRSALFAPYVVSLVVVGILWKFLLADKVGLASSVLSTFGLSHSWLGDPTWALWTLVAISVWVFSGYYMVLFLAGLKDIPQDYYEAATLDGAGPWRMFRSITWPLLRPTSFFVGMTSLIAAIAGPQAFDLVFVTTKGGPNNSTQTIVTYTYMQAFQFGDFGYAAAIAAVLLIIMLLLTALLFAVTRGGRFDA